MAVDVLFLTAFGAGVLSFVSPCVLPLVPPYLCYMAGVSFEQFSSENKHYSSERRALIISSLCFILGFSTIFITLGAGASFAGQLLREWQDILAKISGIIIIIIGLNFLGVFNIAALNKDIRFNSSTIGRGPVASYAIGLAFAFGWTPCIGPVLGPILTLASSKQTVVDGALLLAVYSAGLAVPFFLAALFSHQFMKLVIKIRPNMRIIERVIGVLVVLSGVLFLTGGIAQIAYWLLEKFPILQSIG